MFKKKTVLFMLKKVFFALNFICVIFAIANVNSVKVFASDKNENNIAIVDVQKVFESSNIAEKVKKQIDNKEKMIQKNLLDRKKKLEDDFKSLESKRSILSTAELQQKAKRLESEYQTLQMDGGIYTEALTLTKAYAYETIKNRINSSAKEIANDKKNKYNLVISNEFVFYYKSNQVANITNDVINRMNKNKEAININDIYKKTEEDIRKKIVSQHK